MENEFDIVFLKRRHQRFQSVVGLLRVADKAEGPERFAARRAGKFDGLTNFGYGDGPGKPGNRHDRDKRRDEQCGNRPSTNERKHAPPPCDSEVETRTCPTTDEVLVAQAKSQ
jgi:hypothetical protein